MEIRKYEIYNDDEILNLYASVGWTNYTASPEMLKNSYKNSLCILGAYDENKLVGIIRAVGDGYSTVFIQDIIVLPEYQRKGIGTALMKALLEIYNDVYQMELMTDNTEKTISFYKSLGFLDISEFGCRCFLRMEN